MSLRRIAIPKYIANESKIFQQCLIQQTYSEMCQTVPACQMTHFRNMWNQTNLLSRSSPGSSFPHGVSISWISHPGIHTSWWRHQKGTFSESLAFVRGIHRWPANSAHKGQWHEALLFFICAWTNSWANNGDAGDSRRHRAQYDVTVMNMQTSLTKISRTDDLTSSA